MSDNGDVTRKQWVESNYPAYWTGFTPIPNTVLLNSNLSAVAVRIYALLENIHRRRGGRAIEDPSMDDSAVQLNLSLTTFRKGVGELVDAGLLHSERRGQGMPNRLTLIPPAESRVDRNYQSRPKKSTNPRARAILIESEDRDTPNGVSIGVRIGVSVPATVDRTPVRDAEGKLAVDVLAEWNAQAGQTLKSKDWLKKIIMRIREHPELGAVEHAHLIAVTLQHPWWDGAASPSVLYGNGTQFEKCLMAAAGQAGPREQSLTEKMFAHAEKLRQEGR